MAIQELECEARLELAGKRLHFVGILGEGMQRLAHFCVESGAVVSGSDARMTPDVKGLEALGVQVSAGHQNRVPPATELVVISQAIGTDNPEVQDADRREIEVMKFADFVGWILESKRGIAVAGTHGKSTTTSIVAHMLKTGGLDPSYLVGADVPQLGGGAHRGNSEFMVVEACEYRRSFLYLEPEIGIINCVDFDHADYYYDYDDVLQAFCDFAEQISPDGLLVLNADDPSTETVRECAPCRVETFSARGEADWTAERIWRAKKRTNFDLYERGELIDRISMPLYGDHNISNALASIAVARHCGVSHESIKSSLDVFTGPARRLQLVGEAWEIPILSDYAHHPREIQATIRATRQRYPSKTRIFVVFQPHQHSRTKALLDEFATCFEGAHMVICSDIYGARDSEDVRNSVSSLDLVRLIQDHNRLAYCMPDFRDIEEFIVGETVMDDVILIMGAGNIWQIARNIERKIEEKKRKSRIAAA